jgi:hypothetical protein
MTLTTLALQICQWFLTNEPTYAAQLKARSRSAGLCAD